jgi:hypothetical protein
MYRLLIPIALLIGGALSASAQTATGDVLGTIRDESGGVVTGAKVTVRNLETNQPRETISSDLGTIRIPLLPPGNYEVTAEKAGFAKYVQRPVSLSLNQQAQLDVTLRVSATADTVTVVDVTALINTTNSEASTHFDTKRVAELPLSTNRNLLNRPRRSPE